MNRLAPFALLPLCALFGSCALAGKVIQTPVRLLQAGVRTVTDAGDTTSPATREATQFHGVALETTEPIAGPAADRSPGRR